MSRSRSATTSTKAASASKPRRSMAAIVQHGTQQRSSEGRAQEIAAVQSGKYGKLLVSKGYCCKPRWSIGTKPDRKPAIGTRFQHLARPSARAAVSRQPRTVQLALVLGHRQRRHRQPGGPRNGRGPLGDQGFDIAQERVEPGRPFRVDDEGAADQGQTPNIQMAVFEFGDALLVFEVRGLVGGKSELPNKFDNEFYTTDGMIRDGMFYPSGSTEGQKDRGPRGPRHAGRSVRQLHSCRAQPQGRGRERERRSGPLLGGALPPGQHFVSSRQADAVRQAPVGRWAIISKWSHRLTLCGTT